MKPISEALKKISTEQLKDLSVQFKLKKSAPQTVKNALLNPLGLDTVLSKLNTNELKVLKLVYDNKDGINFGELEKELKIGVPNIEKITNTLSQKLLIYIIKNRQLLNNKLDKVYGLEEIAPFINITSAQFLKDHLKKISSSNIKMPQSSRSEKKNYDEKSNRLLHYIIENGGILSLSEANRHTGEKAVTALLASLQKDGCLNLYQVIEPVYNTFLIIGEKAFSYLLKEKKNQPAKKDADVHNGYITVLNMLEAFDTISTYGLFLTKQHEFRKIDKRRISDAMIKVQSNSGSYLSGETLADLSLFLLNRLQCLILTKDIVNITLKSLKKELENPKKIIQKIIKSLDYPVEHEELFPSPIELPDSTALINVLKITSDFNGMSKEILVSTALAMMIAQSRQKSLDESIKKKQRYLEIINNSLKLLTILGILDIKKGDYFLSDIGYEICSQLIKTATIPPPVKQARNIYINPDFTIIIPILDVPSITVYHLLTHSEIVKQDILLHAHISKTSIVKAQKRGMPVKTFTETLENNSKNEIPQNLKFLLNEWSAQTIKIDISRCIILKSSHPSFIDEISMGKLADAIIERISQNHIIISKKYIDDIIKMAQKKDTVIKMFMDPEEEDEA